MEMTGLLTVSDGVSQLAGARLARSGGGNPFAAATNFLAGLGFKSGDLITVTGTNGSVGTVPVFFITNAVAAGG